MEQESIVNFQGRDHRGVPVEVNQANEHWNQYLLEDGSILKLRTVVLQAVRLIGEYDADGNPVYVVKSNTIVAVPSSPEALRKRP